MANSTLESSAEPPITAPAPTAISPAAIPAATISRLPVYMRVLLAMEAEGIATVRSEALAEAANVQAALLRRDLSWFGTYGIRGVGYDVTVLLREIGQHIGAERTLSLILIGAGSLGQALARHLVSSARGFKLVAAVDVDPRIIGTELVGCTITNQANLEATIAATAPEIALIATPADQAQQAADTLVAAGVRSLLNLAPTTLNVGPGVIVRSVDIAQELQILAFHEAHREGGR